MSAPLFVLVRLDDGRQWLSDGRDFGMHPGAAPDLLAACELLCSAWEAAHGAPGMSNSAYMEARAAIAKARRTP